MTDIKRKTRTNSTLADLKSAAQEAIKVIAQATETAAKTLGNATDKATSIIASAALEASKLLASAALEASKLIASNAAEAVKVSNKQNGNDHDLLIRLETKMEGLKSDIRDLKDGTNNKIADHEKRLGALESSKTRQNTLMSIGIGLLSLLVGLLLFHLFKI